MAEKFSNAKFHKIPPTMSQVVPCRRTDTGRDMADLTVTFCNFENALKLSQKYTH
jgi:hypothetical protein